MDKEKSVSSLSSKESIDVKQTLKSLYVKAGLSSEIHLSFLIPEGVHTSAEKGRKRPFFFHQSVKEIIGCTCISTCKWPFLMRLRPSRMPATNSEQGQSITTRKKVFRVHLNGERSQAVGPNPDSLSPCRNLRCFACHGTSSGVTTWGWQALLSLPVPHNLRLFYITVCCTQAQDK